MKQIVKARAKIAALLVALTLSVSPVYAGDQVAELNTPDQNSQQMYLRGIPMQAIVSATVQSIVKGAPKAIIQNAATCIKQYAKVDSYDQVVSIIIAAHPGVVSASTQSNLHESAAGQKILFFCGEELAKASPVVIKHLQNTMDHYLQLALADNSKSKAVN